VPEIAAGWTLEDLLAHRTGTTADLLGEAVRHGIRPCDDGQSAALWAVIFGCKPVVELVAGQSHYSDVDFLLAQAVCDRATGNGLASLMAAELFGPLGLDDTCFCPKTPGRCVPTEIDERWRHRLVVGEVHDEMAATLGGVAGHAGLFATASDVGRFCEMSLDRWRSGTAFEPHSDHFGLGWRLCNSSFFPTLAQYEAVGHLGFTGTSAFLFPRSRTAFVLLTNRVHPTRDAAPSRLPLLARMGEVVAGKFDAV
jgi:CubicO group peptidase (beta-lactamase class C family)